MHGRDITFTVGDLQTIADTYDPRVLRAPIVIGHPRDDAPAYGWVDRVELDGDRLYAVATDLSDTFVDWLEEEYYSQRSASIFLPQQSPTDGFYLRHVGFLGAAPPAIPGLEAHQFAGAADGVVTVDLSAAASSPVVSTLKRLFERAFDTFVRDNRDRLETTAMDADDGDAGTTDSDPDDPPTTETDPMAIDFASASHPGDILRAAIDDMAGDGQAKDEIQNALADEMDIDRSTLMSILDGDTTDISEDQMRAAAAMFRSVSLDDLMAALPDEGGSADMSAALKRRERRLRARERRLQEREKGARREEAASFAAKLKEDGKILPRHEETVAEMTFHLSEANTNASVDLSAHGGETDTDLVEAFKSMLGDLGTSVDFAERSASDPDAATTRGSADFEAPQGHTVSNTPRMRLHKKAVDYMNKNGVSYDEAVDAVQ